jgi:hypothetical protein
MPGCHPASASIWRSLFLRVMCFSICMVKFVFCGFEPWQHGGESDAGRRRAPHMWLDGLGRRMFRNAGIALPERCREAPPGEKPLRACEAVRLTAAPICIISHLLGTAHAACTVRE